MNIKNEIKKKSKYDQKERSRNGSKNHSGSSEDAGKSKNCSIRVPRRSKSGKIAIIENYDLTKLSHNKKELNLTLKRLTEYLKKINPEL